MTSQSSLIEAVFLTKDNWSSMVNLYEVSILSNRGSLSDLKKLNKTKPIFRVSQSSLIEAVFLTEM